MFTAVPKNNEYSIYKPSNADIVLWFLVFYSTLKILQLPKLKQKLDYMETERKY